jgi:DNA-binding protein HU-beta
MATKVVAKATKAAPKKDVLGKIDLIEYIAKKSGLPKNKSEEIFDNFSDFLFDNLKKGKSIQFIGLFGLKVVARAARKGRNPSTGAEIKIPATKVVRFAAGKKLKDTLNG